MLRPWLVCGSASLTVKAHHDFECGSTCDLRLCGAYRYAEDPETRVWMMSWRIGDGLVQRWHPGEPEPREFLDHVARNGVVAAHNAGFERLVWNVTLRSRPEYAHWPALRIEQQDCTMSRALAVHLPANLDTLARVLGLADQKDKAGASLMMKMVRPRKIFPPQGIVDMPEEQLTRRANGETILWWNTPENLAREGAYCDRDVLAECGVDERLPPLSPDERALWELDQKINDRGVSLDVATIERAVEVRKVALRRADARMAELTDGAVRKCTEATRIVSWLRERGVECDSIGKDDHEEIKIFADCVGDAAARAVVELRAEATKTSTAKFDKMLASVCADGRARGLFNYHRALTGRWGGASCQPQNLPRVDEERDLPRVLAAIEAMEMCA